MKPDVEKCTQVRKYKKFYVIKKYCGINTMCFELQFKAVLCVIT